MKYRIKRVYRNCMPGKTGFTGKQVDAVLEVHANYGIKEGQVIDVQEVKDMRQSLSWSKMSERNLSKKAQGRGMGPGGLGLGPSGSCICPDCGFEIPHERGEGCVEKMCPECGALMERVANRKGMNHWGVMANKKAQVADILNAIDMIIAGKITYDAVDDESLIRIRDQIRDGMINGKYTASVYQSALEDAEKAMMRRGLDIMASRKAQATEDEQAFAEEIAKQISEFAGDEKDVGQIIEMIKGKTFTKEEKEADGEENNQMATVPDISGIGTFPPLAKERVPSGVFPAVVPSVKPQASRTSLETEIIKAARSGMQPKDIADVMGVPIEIVAELVKKAQRRAEKVKMKCMECGNVFMKNIGMNTYEVKCPKCGGYDTEVV